MTNRNYHDEYLKQKKTCVSKNIKIKKDVNRKLTLKLKQTGKTFTSLVNEKINDFLKEDKQ